MFSPYSPAFASEVGTLAPAVFTELAAAGFAAVLLVLLCELDEHAFNQIIKKAITATAANAVVFHQSRDRLVAISLFIVLSPFIQAPGAPNTPRFHHRSIHCVLTPSLDSSERREVQVSCQNK